jgi:hypothetical protein
MYHVTRSVGKTRSPHEFVHNAADQLQLVYTGRHEASATCPPVYIYGTGRQGAPAPFLTISDAPQSVNQQRKKGQHYKLLFVARTGGYIYIWRYHNVDKLQPEVTSGILSCHAIKRYIARLTDGPSCQRTWGSDTGCIPARGVSFRLSLTLYSRRRVTLRFSLPLQVTSYGHEGMYGVYTRCNAIQTNSSEAV